LRYYSTIQIRHKCRLCYAGGIKNIILSSPNQNQNVTTIRVNVQKHSGKQDNLWQTMKEYNEASEYAIHGGHRTTEAFVAGGTRRVRLYEVDTTLWDSPHRYSFSYELYFKHVLSLLWFIYADVPLEERVGFDIPNEIISHMPTLERLGLIRNTQNKPCVKIPVLKKTEYDELCAVMKGATEKIKYAIGEEFTSFITSMKTSIPRHLTSVPELFRYHEATKYFVMAIVREAYNKGLHLKNVDYCCPPVVMVYACAE